MNELYYALLLELLLHAKNDPLAQDVTESPSHSCTSFPRFHQPGGLQLWKLLAMFKSHHSEISLDGGFLRVLTGQRVAQYASEVMPKRNRY